MRRWRTGTGDELVEHDGNFFVCSGGAVTRSFLPSDSSVDDWLYQQRYRVEDDALVCDFSGESWSGRETREATRELSGLVLLQADPVEEAAVLALLRRQKAEQEARASTAADADERRLASFVAALPAAPGELRFSFGYDGADVVVRGADGTVLWRDSTWQWQGRELFRALKPLLAKAYAPRKVRFDVVVEGENFLRFNPD